MKDASLIYYLLCIYTVVLASNEDSEYYGDSMLPGDENRVESSDSNTFMQSVPECWMKLDTPRLFNVMGEIDDKYASIRNEIQDSLDGMNFDKLMINGFVSSRGAAYRELHATNHNPWMIPSGLNLGGYCMVRMAESVLFFHRMKLRNNTYFRVDSLKNDLANMVVRINMSLNDLHLKGAYERSLTDNDPSVLIYAPAFGQIEVLMKDVLYKIEGRYRLIRNRLTIELITSEMIIDNILMMYINQNIENQAVRLEKEHLVSFISRLKTDLDDWLKDYFNDVLIYAGMEGVVHIDELAKYDKEKESALEEYTDFAVNAIGTRIRNLGAENVRLPVFTFKTTHGLQIKLYEGVLRGLDSMYRRSVATGLMQRSIYKLDTVVGFSNLKVVYKYEAVIPTGVPPLAGVLTFSANELTAHLALAMINDPETIDLDIEFLDQMKCPANIYREKCFPVSSTLEKVKWLLPEMWPESLTVEGAANIMISNFRHLLEHQITTTMSNTLIHGIRMLRSLPGCKPFIPAHISTTEDYSYSGFESNDYLTNARAKKVRSNKKKKIR